MEKKETNHSKGLNQRFNKPIYISPRQKMVGRILTALGVLISLIGLFGWLAGDLQLNALQPLADQVYSAREIAQSAGVPISGTLDLYGENSGVRLYYAEYKTEQENGVFSAENFDIGSSKKTLKGDGIQLPGTKDYQNLVVAEETPVKLDNGIILSRSAKLKGAGTARYQSLKFTSGGKGALTIYAVSSLENKDRNMALYSAKTGEKIADAVVPAMGDGELSPITFNFDDADTYFLTTEGKLPIAPLSVIMNGAVIILIIGLTLLFNGIMLMIQKWEDMKDLFCVEPALIFFLLFVYYPVIDMVRISFTDMSILTAGRQKFVGLANYNWLFNQSGAKYFWESLRITATYMFWEMFITLVGGMLLALLFNRISPAYNAMRVAVFVPKYIAVSISAVVFMWILYSPAAATASQTEGILNYTLSLFGIQGPRWLIDANTALSGVLVLTSWRVVGYAMMIYLSAMQGIPQDYYEAARIDGADGVHQFRYITIPLLAPTTLFLFVTTFIASMKVFQSVDVMTGGGPGRATNVMVQWIYNLTFKDFRTARGAAVSVVFFVILLVCTIATMKYSRKSVNYDS